MKKLIIILILAISVSVITYFIIEPENALLKIQAQLGSETAKDNLAKIYLEKGDMDNYIYWVNKIDPDDITDPETIKIMNLFKTAQEK